MKSRAVSAPYFSIKSCGSTPLFFDFDIVPRPSDSTGLPSERNAAPVRWPLSSCLSSTSAGVEEGVGALGSFGEKILFGTNSLVSRGLKGSSLPRNGTRARLTFVQKGEEKRGQVW